jgi:hypothetical protein
MNGRTLPLEKQMNLASIQSLDIGDPPARMHSQDFIADLRRLDFLVKRANDERKELDRFEEGDHCLDGSIVYRTKLERSKLSKLYTYAECKNVHGYADQTPSTLNPNLLEMEPYGATLERSKPEHQYRLPPIEYGCAAAHSLQLAGGSCVWLGRNVPTQITALAIPENPDLQQQLDFANGIIADALTFIDARGRWMAELEAIVAICAGPELAVDKNYAEYCLTPGAYLSYAAWSARERSMSWGLT